MKIRTAEVNLLSPNSAKLILGSSCSIYMYSALRYSQCRYSFLIPRRPRPLCTSLRRDVKIQRPDQLELRIVLNGLQSLPREFIPIHQLGQQNLHFQQGKVESNAPARPRSKRDVGAAMPILHFLSVPPVRIELERVPPDSRVHVDGI